MELAQYFDRIAFRGNATPTFANLCELQRAHVCAVPFENLDVQLGRPVTIDAEAAYQKIVVGNRGGWCYEQNGLLAWALSEMGFDVTRVAAAVMRDERGEISTANHLCLLVDEHLVDVGFGGSLFEPIRLEQTEYAQAPFRLGLRQTDDGYWRFWEDLGSGEFSFDFVAEPADESALASRCEFLQSDPSSNFVLNLVAQLRSPEQHKSLRGRVLSIATPDGIESQTLNSAEELVTTLAEQFQLDVPEVADLWPKISARHDEVFN